jgi:ribosome biogenesis SPOUT family RNA methylase Rps3
LKILNESAASVTLRAQRAAATEPEWDGALEWEQVDDADVAVFPRILGGHTGRHGTSDKRLRQVARVYVSTPEGQSGIQAVAQALTVSASHAGRLVRMAKARTDPATGTHFL